MDAHDEIVALRLQVEQLKRHNGQLTVRIATLDEALGTTRRERDLGTVELRRLRRVLQQVEIELSPVSVFVESGNLDEVAAISVRCAALLQTVFAK